MRLIYDVMGTHNTCDGYHAEMLCFPSNLKKNIIITFVDHENNKNTYSHFIYICPSLAKLDT